MKMLLVAVSLVLNFPKFRLYDSKSNSTSIETATEIRVVGFSGSLDVTVMLFFCCPFLRPVLKVTSISPSPPGGMSVLVKTAAVHPHPALAFISLSGASPMFCTMNLCVTFDPCETLPKSWDVSGKKILGVPPLTVSAVALGVSDVDLSIVSLEVSAACSEPFDVGAEPLAKPQYQTAAKASRIMPADTTAFLIIYFLAPILTLY